MLDSAASRPIHVGKNCFHRSMLDPRPSPLPSPTLSALPHPSPLPNHRHPVPSRRLQSRPQFPPLCRPRCFRLRLPKMLRAINDHAVTYLPLVPPILVAMVAHSKPLPLGKLRKVLSGGAPLSKEIIEGFRDKYPQVEILQGYGLTESTAIGASTDSAEESRRYGTAGLLSPSIEAKIVDSDTGEALPMNRTGELWLRGPYIMKGSKPSSNTF